ncbi:MAG: class I SAM-dependent methyltransferase [Flavobacteriaceae bacterium]|nr:class I SAM-dependent methyltransferase [Flavobacteriaceae bacterium]
MNKHILNTVNQKFINDNLDTDIVSLLLSKTDFKDVDIKDLVEQIEAKKKCKTKLPTWYITENIYYPNKLNIEQTSSEITAQYKSTLLKGKSLIDLTGGFGVDAFYFSKQFREVTHCELDANLSLIAEHNFKTLKINHITTVATDGIHYLKESNSTYDCIYIDPSRRHDSKGKVFYLKDCLPDVTKHLDLLFKHSRTILIKVSPMLDISIGLSELKWVKDIHVVALDSEVKELLFLLEKNFEGEISIKTVNLLKDDSQFFEFKMSEEKSTEPNYSLPKKYAYEPNSAIMKAGAFSAISKKLNISKLHKHSHLYTSENEIEFPGRRFKIVRVLPYSKKVIAKQFSKTKANVTTRNFPETVAQIRKKYCIKDGGELYLFFTTNVNNEKIVIVTEQIRK